MSNMFLRRIEEPTSLSLTLVFHFYCNTSEEIYVFNFSFPTVFDYVRYSLGRYTNAKGYIISWNARNQTFDNLLFYRMRGFCYPYITNKISEIIYININQHCLNVLKMPFDGGLTVVWPNISLNSSIHHEWNVEFSSKSSTND